MKRKTQEWTTPDEGLKLLENAELKYGEFDNIPEVDFEIDYKKLKTHLKSIRLTEYIIEGFEELAKNYDVKPQSLMKTVLEEYLTRNLLKRKLKHSH